MRIVFSLLMAAVPLAAHPGELLQPHDLPAAWGFDPGIVIPLALAAWLYMQGASLARGFRSWEIACFWVGWIVLSLSLLSPIHPLGEALFSAHMVQHELIMTVAAPLFVLGRPLIAGLWALPLRWRKLVGQASKAFLVQRGWNFLTLPLVAWLVHAVVLWGWHVPVLFQQTLRNDFIHSLQHISFLGAALLYWWSLFHAHGRKGYGVSVLSLFTTAVHTVLLGALLTTAPSPLYPAYSARTALWGLTPLEDQQLAGLIMWVPAGIVYVGAGLALCAFLLRETGVPWNLVEDRP
jgi:cytochrome c oxidase assembly factor CtaG